MDWNLVYKLICFDGLDYFKTNFEIGLTFMKFFSWQADGLICKDGN